MEDIDAVFAGLSEPGRYGSGKYANTGEGITFQPIDIGHPDYVALIDPDTAFWALVLKESLGDALSGGSLLEQYREKRKKLFEEMDTLRFRLAPTAVYFNPTERCNLNCAYCYIPEHLRKSGHHMSQGDLMHSLEILKTYFDAHLPSDRKAQVIFHGSEPMLNRDAIFEAIEKYRSVFDFGIQTNGTLLDSECIHFIKEHGTALGLSLDAHLSDICDKTRKTWSGKGVFKKVLRAIEELDGYYNFNVICTVSSENVRYLKDIVAFFHSLKVPACMLNPIRCTQPGARDIKPPELLFAERFLEALEHSHELYELTGQKLVVVNFANILVSILAPLARKLMCDISPCGGGRSFFAVAADGGLFPCSEFIGLPEFRAGSIFDDRIDDVLKSTEFRAVTCRIVERISPCARCAIRHFCGSPCPAEAYSIEGDINRRGAFCSFYEEQVRYAFRQIAEGTEEAFLWDGWDTDTETIINISTM